MSEVTRVPFIDLSRQFRALEPELQNKFLEVGRSGVYIMGPMVEAFEQHAAEFCGVKHAIAVADGSAALFLVLKALGIGAGDEVITAPNSFIASAWTVVAAGARPTFADVSEDLNIDPECVEAAITPRTRAIMPVHLTGRPAKMDEINAIAERHGLFVLEDAAQAIGARYRGRRTGSLGGAAGFSLHPLKNLGIYGDGGLITTNDSGLDAKLRLLRNHGLKNRDECVMWGYNSRLDPMQAAFADVKLQRLDEWNARCREIAATFRGCLGSHADVPRDEQGEECVYHNFVIRTDRRDELKAHLEHRGIGSAIHYPIPLHLQEAAKDLGYSVGDFPRAERYASTMLSLPIYPELERAEIEYVVNGVLSFFR